MRFGLLAGIDEELIDFRVAGETCQQQFQTRDRFLEASFPEHFTHIGHPAPPALLPLPLTFLPFRSGQEIDDRLVVREISRELIQHLNRLVKLLQKQQAPSLSRAFMKAPLCFPEIDLAL